MLDVCWCVNLQRVATRGLWSTVSRKDADRYFSQLPFFKEFSGAHFRKGIEGIFYLLKIEDIHTLLKINNLENRLTSPDSYQVKHRFLDYSRML